MTSWSQASGGNTFSTLLEGMKNVEIANIYYRADLPDSNVAQRYFQIVESNVIKSILNPHIRTGREVKSCAGIAQATQQSKSEKKRYVFFSKNRNQLFLWGRELLWKLGRWKSKELKAFLDDFDPDVFMFPIGSYAYSNRVNEYIIDHFKPSKVIVFWWDDNFTYKQEKSISYYISRYFTRRFAKRLMTKATDVMAISPMMKRECDEFFSVNSTIITKPIRLAEKPAYAYDAKHPIRLIYTGSMVIGRYKSLISLANALREINKNGIRAYLDIYSSTVLKEKDMQALNIPGTSSIKGCIPQSQVFKEQLKSDILVFVESFENKVARLSFSTKITDYLSSHRCIFAIGPNDISSMDYLSSEDAAIICTSENSILPNLQKLIERPQLIEDYADKGWDCGIRNHNADKIRERVKELIFK